MKKEIENVIAIFEKAVAEMLEVAEKVLAEQEKEKEGKERK